MYQHDGDADVVTAEDVMQEGCGDGAGHAGWIELGLGWHTKGSVGTLKVSRSQIEHWCPL